MVGREGGEAWLLFFHFILALYCIVLRCIALVKMEWYAMLWYGAGGRAGKGRREREPFYAGLRPAVCGLGSSRIVSTSRSQPVWVGGWVKGEGGRVEGSGACMDKWMDGVYSTHLAASVCLAGAIR